MRNLKKVVALVAVFAMMVSTVAFAQTYSDVVETDVYAEAVETLSALGIFTGDDADGDGVMDFRPADTITRAEVAAIVCRIQNLNIVGAGSTPFVDVPSSHWASGYVAQAAGQGIINGYGDGNFGPDDNVTYEQVIKMLMETLGYNLFANSNGGYPSGYLAAAQRWEVLDGVVGGAVGAEASRGMVAQLVNNAIDTPLMQQTVWGSDNNWEVLDGGLLAGGTGNRQFSTLLKRDLKVYKASGVVDANSYADLTTGNNALNTDNKKTIHVNFDGNEVNVNYGFVDSYGNLRAGVTGNFYQAEVDADAFLGKAVTLYAAQKLDGNFELVTIAKANGLNKEVSFNIDLYDGIVTNTNQQGDPTSYDLAYLTSAASNNAIKARVEAGAQVIVNGSAAGNGALTGFFGNNTDTTQEDPTYLATIDPVDNESYSGKVTLINNDDDTAYDVVEIEIGSSAVIKSVGANGQVNFQSAAMIPYVNNGAFGTPQRLTLLNFEDENTALSIKLTKDGEAIDYTELNKWDVVTVVSGAIGGVGSTCEVYDVSVLSEENAVDGYIAAINNKGQIKLNDGNWYTYKSGAYGLNAVKNGLSGRFYIDAYGKVVALDDDVEVEGVEFAVADNYAVVLDAKSDTNGFGNDIVLQLLTKDGEIAEKKLAATIALENYDKVNVNGNTANALALNGNDAQTVSDFSVKKADLFLNNATNANLLIADLKGEMISFTENSAGAVKAITFAQHDDEENLYTASARVAVRAKYKDDEMEFDNGVAIDEDTIVFYVTNAANNANVGAYGTAISGTPADFSRVATGADLASGTYTMIAFDYQDTAKAVIVYNTTGEIRKSANVAVIVSVAETVVNGVDKVNEVAYYQNGELKTAVTSEDLGTAMASATLGDVYSINVSNGVITAATLVMDYNTSRKVDIQNSVVEPVTNSKALNIDETANNNAAQEDDVVTKFGALVKVSNNGKLSLVASGSNSAAAEISGADLENANVYVVDPNKRDEARLYVGSAASAYVDDTVTADKLAAGKTTRKLTMKWANGALITNASLTAGNYDMSLLSHVFAYEYDGDAIDVVIYLPFKYTVTNVSDN